MNLILERRLQPSVGGLRQWWRAIDKGILAAMLFLGAVGIVLAFSTSPSLAARNPGDLHPFYFADRQLAFVLPALAICLGISAISPREIRRVGVLLFGAVLLMLVIVLVFGEVRNGSQRWLSIFGFSIQPSEFAKPALIVISAWMFSLSDEREGPPGPVIALICLAVTALLVARQPDYSQTALIAASWAVVFFLTGASIVWAISAAILAVAGGAIAYAVSPYVAERVQILFDVNATSGGEQISKALAAIREGGITGVGPGEGIWKTRLPDAHSDFGIAVIAEEFGLIATLLVILAYLVIVIRGFLAAGRLKDGFARLASGGLAGLIGLQAAIHLGVSAKLLPPTGMTLPLVSYGGSSLLAMGFAFGMLLGLTRRDLERMP